MIHSRIFCKQQLERIARDMSAVAAHTDNMREVSRWVILFIKQMFNKKFIAESLAVKYPWIPTNLILPYNIM